MRYLLVTLGVVFCASSGLALEKMTEVQRAAGVKDAEQKLPILVAKTAAAEKRLAEQEKLKNSGNVNQYDSAWGERNNWLDQMEDCKLKLSTLKGEYTVEDLEKQYKKVAAEATKACEARNKLALEAAEKRKIADEDKASKADKAAADRAEEAAEAANRVTMRTAPPVIRYEAAIKIAKQLGLYADKEKKDHPDKPDKDKKDKGDF